MVGADGSFFKANFEKGGEATRIAYATFAKQQSSTDLGGVMSMSPGSPGSGVV